jgi:tetratricopeptide (TPR) repeat protein
MKSFSLNSLIVFVLFSKVRYYIKLDKIDEGERCVKEVTSISPLSHQMFYMRGLINDARGQLKLAKQNYNDVLAINPYHFPTLIQLTKLLIQIGNYSLAEKYARDAISIQPANYHPW